MLIIRRKLQGRAADTLLDDLASGIAVGLIEQPSEETVSTDDQPSSGQSGQEPGLLQRIAGIGAGGAPAAAAQVAQAVANNPAVVGAAGLGELIGYGTRFLSIYSQMPIPRIGPVQMPTRPVEIYRPPPTELPTPTDDRTRFEPWE